MPYKERNGEKEKRGRKREKSRNQETKSIAKSGNEKESKKKSKRKKRESSESSNGWKMEIGDHDEEIDENSVEDDVDTFRDSNSMMIFKLEILAKFMGGKMEKLVSDNV